MMNRKPVFDAARAEGADFSRPGNIQILDNALSLLGFPAEAPATMLSPSAACTTLMREYEGYARKLPDGRVQAYPDPGSGGEPWTIGFGSTTDSEGRPIAPGTVWTREQAEEKFAADVARFGGKVWALVKDVPTTQSQYDAMVSLAYNIGVGNFSSSTLLKKHRSADYEGAAAQFPLWDKASGRVLPGLVKRRAAEMRVYKGLPT